VKKNGKKIELNLNEIEENDVERLTEIIIENTVANTV
jgi:phosphoribosylformylglycinamidine (FGAM) synthase PurS component